MTNRNESSSPSRDRAFTLLFALLVTALGCTLVLLSVPRAVPLSLPVLQLPRDQVRAQLAQDARLAARAPNSKEALELYALLLETGKQELAQHAVDRLFHERLPGHLARLQGVLTPADIEALRARAVERFMQALEGTLANADEARGLLGEQPGLLGSYGYLTTDGSLLAPALSVRATYKVRWNLLFGRPAHDKLSKIERCAYEGFRGLEAHGLPPELREQALLAFHKAGCAGAGHALAIWQAHEGAPEQLLALARAGDLPLRMRNMAVAFLRAGEANDY